MKKENDKNGHDQEETPIPTGQLACVVFMQLAESTTINVLFPFIVFMVEDFGMKPIGLYTGLLASSFSGAQFFSSMLWGKFSDRFGRKPALMLGLIGSTIASLVFGFSQSYTQAIVARLTAGLLNGNIGVLKCFLTEITDDSNRSKGFSTLSLAYSIGSIISPMAGGLLARPNESFPSTFDVDKYKDNSFADNLIELFVKFPYLLPMLVPLLFQFIAIMTCLLFVKETVKFNSTTMIMTNDKKKMKKKTVSNVTKPVYSPIHDDINDDDEVEMVILAAASINNNDDDDDGQLIPSKKPPSTLSNPSVIYTTCNYGLIAFAYVILDETLPLLMKLSSSHGGLSFTSKQIGQVLSICGFIHFFYVTFFLPNVDKLVGGRFSLLHVGNLAALPFIILIPIQSYVLMSASSSSSSLSVTQESSNFNWSMFGFYVSIITVLALKNVFCSMSFLAIMIMVNHCVKPSKLGLVNGFGQSLASLARCVGPALGGAVWSMTVADSTSDDHNDVVVGGDDDDDIGAMMTNRELTDNNESSSSSSYPITNFLIVSVCLIISSLIGKFKMPKSLEKQMQEEDDDDDGSHNGHDEIKQEDDDLDEEKSLPIEKL